MTTASPRATLAIGFILCVTMLTTACSGGQRPVLVEDPPPTPLPELVLELAPAPAGTPPLPAVAEDFPLQPTVDDALIAWAADRDIPYRDSCTLISPGPGEYCDMQTRRETVRLLGPSAGEVWYVVTVSETSDIDLGTGYRVAAIDIAGQQ